MEKYNGLTEFIDFLEATMGIHICIKDHIGFIPLDPALDQALFGHLAHLNPFCMYIKSDPKVYIRCTSMIHGMRRKLVNGRYCGVCHAGVREYIVPIVHSGNIIGSVNAGVLSAPEEIVERNIHNVCTSSTLDEQYAHELYNQFITPVVLDEKALYSSLEVIANLLAIAFSCIVEYSDFNQKRIETVELHNNIIADTIDYLQRNYKEACSVKELADNAHCSVSCLSHVFKQRVGVSIPVFLNRLRVDRAKEELSDYNQTIAEVAIKSGFSDPNYFSRTFTRYAGFSPSAFRQTLLQNTKRIDNPAENLKNENNNVKGVTIVHDNPEELHNNR